MVTNRCLEAEIQSCALQSPDLPSVVSLIVLFARGWLFPSPAVKSKFRAKRNSAFPHGARPSHHTSTLSCDVGLTIVQAPNFVSYVNKSCDKLVLFDVIDRLNSSGCTRQPFLRPPNHPLNTETCSCW